MDAKYLFYDKHTCSLCRSQLPSVKIKIKSIEAKPRNVIYNRVKDVACIKKVYLCNSCYDLFTKHNKEVES